MPWGRNRSGGLSYMMKDATREAYPPPKSH